MGVLQPVPSKTQSGFWGWNCSAWLWRSGMRRKLSLLQGKLAREGAACGLCVHLNPQLQPQYSGILHYSAFSAQRFVHEGSGNAPKFTLSQGKTGRGHSSIHPEPAWSCNFPLKQKGGKKHQCSQQGFSVELVVGRSLL